MNNKRGLSAVVTTLMIILLVLIAVGIVWVVVKNIVEGGAEEIDFGAKCMKIDIGVKSFDADTNTYVLERGADNEADPAGIYLLFTDSEEMTEKIKWGGEIPGPLGTADEADIAPELEGTLETVAVVVYFLDSAGQEQLCSPMNSYTLPEAE